MKKKTKLNVFLTSMLPRIGEKGSIISVRPGFARNFIYRQNNCIILDAGKKDTNLLKLKGKISSTIANLKKIREVTIKSRVEDSKNKLDKRLLHRIYKKKHILTYIKNIYKIECQSFYSILKAPDETVRYTGTYTLEFIVNGEKIDILVHFLDI